MAIEVVIFHVLPDVARGDFLAAVAETTALLQTQGGFLSRTVSQAESGEWLDILDWASVEAAKKAVSVFQSDPAGQRFSSYMDPQHIQVFYTETVAS
ncbi:antibiotic biosynthesis monooxygenase [Ktedonobacter sp. SOSP1-85]|uniref:antibiotic biosynthesis monooxygenase family protein n=1 Tax=Ktedonobacter sp. SOSP1-85 TaxID=2778367 RepID=UPI001915D1E3|nr:hypothetical protein [Ktedonobacter sp. SOSP1-85]